MKILVVWIKYFNYLEGIASGLRQNGHEVWTHVIDTVPKERSYIKRALHRKALKRQAEQHCNNSRADIMEKVDELHIDLCVIINGNKDSLIYEETFFAELKHRGVKTILWAVDAINKMKYESFLNCYDSVFSFELEDVKFAKEKYNVTLKYLPLGADSDIYDNLNSNCDKAYDVCFVGGMNKEKMQVLDFVAKYCLRKNKKMVVYGHIWRDMGLIRGIKNKFKYKDLAKCMVERKIEPSDLAKLYKKTKININVTRKEHSSLNPRAFEILGTRSFQMIDYNANYEKILKNNKHVVMYKNMEDLERLLDYYLENENERNIIAMNGYELVSNKYLLNLLVRELVERH